MTLSQSTMDAIMSEFGTSWRDLADTDRGHAHMEWISRAVVNELENVGFTHTSTRQNLEALTCEVTQKVFVVATDTGEIVGPLYHSYAETLEDPGYPLPSQARDREELIAAFHDNPLLPSREHYRLTKGALLNDALANDDVTLGEWKLLNRLLDSLDIANYVFTSTKALQAELRLSPAALSRHLRSLEDKNLIHVVSKDKTRRGDRLIAVHPLVGFKGYMGDTWAVQMLEHWYGAESNNEQRMEQSSREAGASLTASSLREKAAGTHTKRS
ncbi:MAG: ArsR family transcriptional regulator [Gammaproteobacteria bacterium]|nr:ArsR family transcriptional regulator [Gammaproteobacteria bacterium]